MGWRASSSVRREAAKIILIAIDRATFFHLERKLD